MWTSSSNDFLVASQPGHLLVTRWLGVAREGGTEMSKIKDWIQSKEEMKRELDSTDDPDMLGPYDWESSDEANPPTRESPCGDSPDKAK